MIKINGYAIDAALSEDHDHEAEVTEFPVEQGGNITDHVRIKPIQVTIKGVVSDTPIGAVAAIRDAANVTIGDGDVGDAVLPSVEALAFLRATFEAGKEITIETSIKTYDDMIMERLSIPQSAETGEALMFTATFKQIIIEANKRVVIRAVPIGQPKRARGNADGKPAGWVGTDSKGRDITVNKLGPGVEPKYTRADGTEVSADEARDAAKKNDAVLIKYDENGNAIPVDSRDYQPYTPKQKKPYWAPNPRAARDF